MVSQALAIASLPTMPMLPRLGFVLTESTVNISWSMEEAMLKRKVRLGSGYDILPNHRKIRIRDVFD
jgi:hypothetical protein